PPGGQPLDIMPIERNETGVGELRRGAQLAGAECGGRASDAGEVGFDRIKTFGQRQRSREARALDAEAGLGGNPARILELMADEAVSAGWERLNRRHGRGLCEIGSGPSIARYSDRPRSRPLRSSSQWTCMGLFLSSGCFGLC